MKIADSSVLSHTSGASQDAACRAHKKNGRAKPAGLRGSCCGTGVFAVAAGGGGWRRGQSHDKAKVANDTKRGHQAGASS